MGPQGALERDRQAPLGLECLGVRHGHRRVLGEEGGRGLVDLVAESAGARVGVQGAKDRVSGHQGQRQGAADTVAKGASLKAGHRVSSAVESTKTAPPPLAR